MGRPTRQIQGVKIWQAGAIRKRSGTSSDDVRLGGNETREECPYLIRAGLPPPVAKGRGDGNSQQIAPSTRRKIDGSTEKERRTAAKLISQFPPNYDSAKRASSPVRLECNRPFLGRTTKKQAGHANPPRLVRQILSVPRSITFTLCCRA